MSPLEFVLFGVACYVFGLVSGAVVIPWLVDRGLFPVRRHERHPPSEYRWARQVSAVLLIAVVVARPRVTSADNV